MCEENGGVCEKDVCACELFIIRYLMREKQEVKKLHLYKFVKC